MLRALREAEPAVSETFAEADRAMTPLLGRPLSEYIFVDPADAGALAQAEEDLKQTAITQPAVLASDIALTRLLAAYGIVPDMVMGHSLGEYGALVAAGALPFADALEAVSARGREMTRVSVEDNGKMAAVFAPIAEIEKVLARMDGYLVIANYNSHSQVVIGGASAAVEAAVAAFTKAGIQAVLLPVSHAFHTRIVAPASEPFRRTLDRLHIEPPRVPVVANVTGDFYPMDTDARPHVLEVLGPAGGFASPVREGPADPARGGSDGLRRSGPQEGAAGLRRRRPRRRPPGGLAVHQPSQARRRRRLQPSAVRPLRCRAWA